MTVTPESAAGTTVTPAASITNGTVVALGLPDSGVE